MRSPSISILRSTGSNVPAITSTLDMQVRRRVRKPLLKLPAGRSQLDVVQYLAGNTNINFQSRRNAKAFLGSQPSEGLPSGRVMRSKVLGPINLMDQVDLCCKRFVAVFHRESFVGCHSTRLATNTEGESGQGNGMQGSPLERLGWADKGQIGSL